MTEVLPEENTCAYSECENLYFKRTHNQKYCSDECCRLATNARIMEKYYERKARLKGAVRICKTPNCNTVLSRYNDSKICASCEKQTEEQERKQLIGMLKW